MKSNIGVYSILLFLYRVQAMINRLQFSIRCAKIVKHIGRKEDYYGFLRRFINDICGLINNTLLTSKWKI